MADFSNEEPLGSHEKPEPSVDTAPQPTADPKIVRKQLAPGIERACRKKVSSIFHKWRQRRGVMGASALADDAPQISRMPDTDVTQLNGLGWHRDTTNSLQQDSVRSYFQQVRDWPLNEGSLVSTITLHSALCLRQLHPDTAMWLNEEFFHGFARSATAVSVSQQLRLQVETNELQSYLTSSWLCVLRHALATLL